MRFGSRFLPVPRFMLARGRGGVQGLEHLGPESENLYSPVHPRQCSGIQNMWRGRFGSGAVPIGSLQRFGSVHAVRFLRFGSVPEPSGQIY